VLFVAEPSLWSPSGQRLIPARRVGVVLLSDFIAQLRPACATHARSMRPRRQSSENESPPRTPETNSHKEHQEQKGSASARVGRHLGDAAQSFQRERVAN